MIFRYIMCVHIISAVVILPFILLHLVNTTYFWCDIECLMHVYIWHLWYMSYHLRNKWSKLHLPNIWYTKIIQYAKDSIFQPSPCFTQVIQCVTDWLHYSTKSMACFTEVNCCLLISLLAQKSDDLLLV